MPKTTEKLTARQRTVKARTLQLEAFIRWHHRLPSRIAADPVERAIGSWAYAHCRTKRPSAAVVFLVESAGGYGQKRGGRDVTDVRLLQLQEFIATHGRLPWKSKANKDEAALQQWARQRVSTCVHPDPRVVELIEAHGGYSQRNGTRHLDRTQDLMDFLRAHGRLPRQKL